MHFVSVILRPSLSPVFDCLQYANIEYCKQSKNWSRIRPRNKVALCHIMLFISHEAGSELVSLYPPTAQPRGSYWTTAAIIVATIAGLVLLIAAFFCGILAAGL